MSSAKAAFVLKEPKVLKQTKSRRSLSGVLPLLNLKPAWAGGRTGESTASPFRIIVQVTDFNLLICDQKKEARL